MLAQQVEEHIAKGSIYCKTRKAVLELKGVMYVFL